MKRPNWHNQRDACCCCGHMHDTPKEHTRPEKDQLHVWQPNPGDPPQWICAPCKARLEEDARK